MHGPAIPCLPALLLAAAAGAGMAFAADQPALDPPSVAPAAVAEEDRWSSFLPWYKELALERGYELPRPFGVSLIYNYVGRDITVCDVRIGVDGAPPGSVSGFLNLGSETRVNVGLVRADVWLLPFVNVYALLGYIDNSSTTTARITLPRPGPAPGDVTFETGLETEINGVVGGVGMTLAGGYKEFFLSLDANISATDLGFDNEFRAIVASLRTGWAGKAGQVPLRLWVGGAYWDTENTAASTVNVPDVGVIQFEADQGPANPWNAVAGVSTAFSRSWEMFAEYGFNFDDVQFVAAGLVFRF